MKGKVQKCLESVCFKPPSTNILSHSRAFMQGDLKNPVQVFYFKHK